MIEFASEMSLKLIMAIKTTDAQIYLLKFNQLLTDIQCS